MTDFADRLFDHSREAAITLAEQMFPQGIPREQLLAHARESAHTFLGMEVSDVAERSFAMYINAFVWAYEKRQRALAQAPTANRHPHFID
jgi:hypothetical protein